VKPGLTFTLQEIVAFGIEARCIGPDGHRYLWHRDLGLKVEAHTGRTTLLHDPGTLPDGVWFPTKLGLQELDEPGGTKFMG
jgi:hypothetical protein